MNQLELLKHLREDLPLFSETSLKIIPKDGGPPVAFEMNRAQLYVHSRIEKQLADTGMVRAIVLKGRQQGISTYSAARFYQKTSMQPGRRASIIAHEQKASTNLFNLVKRYHDNNPIRPHTGASNEKALLFDRIDSGYSVMTAGADDVGRSATFQLGHFSEFAFWQNAAMHMAGLGQTIADLPGTEIIIESTANGVGNSFHQIWQKAESGENGYIAIFVPWFWQEEYRAPVPEGFEPTNEEVDLKTIYGLDDEQLVWRRKKIASFEKGKEWLFRQEYPMCAAEAFISATEDPFINPDLVMGAVNSGYLDRSGPLIIGVDPAEFGPDRTVICFRRGRVAPRFECYKGKNTMEVAGIVANIINKHDPDAVFVDAVGIGAGVRDRLRELGFDRVFGVKSGMTATDDDTYANKRAEMWGRVREWLEDHPARLPNEPELLSDLSAPKYVFDSKGRLLIEKKADMKKRGIRSPDYADALCLTFAEPVAVRSMAHMDIARAGGYTPALPAGY